MPRSLHLALALFVLAVMIAGPWWCKHLHDRHFRSLHVVEEGMLYRSGQLDLEGLKTIIRYYRIKTIISLRDGDSALDQHNGLGAQLRCRGACLGRTRPRVE